MPSSFALIGWTQTCRSSPSDEPCVTPTREALRDSHGRCVQHCDVKGRVMTGTLLSPTSIYSAVLTQQGKVLGCSRALTDLYQGSTSRKMTEMKLLALKCLPGQSSRCRCQTSLPRSGRHSRCGGHRDPVSRLEPRQRVAALYSVALAVSRTGSCQQDCEHPPADGGRP